MQRALLRSVDVPFGPCLLRCRTRALAAAGGDDARLTLRSPEPRGATGETDPHDASLRGSGAMRSGMPLPGGLRAGQVLRRVVAVAVASALVGGAMQLGAGDASAATVVQAWQTRVGTRLTDTSTLSVYSTGGGILRIRASKLRAGSSLR